jgi:glutamate---cysteine ligase / carboxylate-amine ligase
MKRPPSYGLFERFGVELEYMIVDAESLDVRPEADELIRQVAGSVDADVSRGRIDWSNELALHLIELKTSCPAPTLRGLSQAFAGEVRYINNRLAQRGARLLPAAMHPWMDPRRQSRLWPHGNREIYAAFHRVFNCRGHGWTNLQSAHLNLPFRNEEELVRLHAALRILLPLLPALAASSPFVEGRPARNLDQRLEVYRHNCRRVPSVTGHVVPEPFRSVKQYQIQVLERIYQDLAPLDPEGILRDEWVNARGIIVRFQRNTVELRMLDVQECPAADLAILQFVVRVLRILTEGPLADPQRQNSISTTALKRCLLAVMRHGGDAPLPSGPYCELFGLDRHRAPPTVRALWRDLWKRLGGPRKSWSELIDLILRQGSLAERLRRAAGPNPSRSTLRRVYGELADCLSANRPFEAEAP